MIELLMCAAPPDDETPPLRGWQPIAWDPVQYVRTLALQEPEDLVLRATSAKTIATALVPVRPDCAGDEIWTTLARSHVANVLLLAADLAWPIADYVSWLSNPPASASHTDPSRLAHLSPAGSEPARQTAGIMWHPDGRIIDSITVRLRESAVYALQHASAYADFPAFTPDHARRAAVTLDTATAAQDPAAHYLAAARRHLAALGTKTNDLQPVLT